VTKNSWIRERGGHLVPQSFKVVLPPTDADLASNSVQRNKQAVVTSNDWPSLPESSSSKPGSPQTASSGAKSAMNKGERRKGISKFD
jgi:hypothetical protein